MHPNRSWPILALMITMAMATGCATTDSGPAPEPKPATVDAPPPPKPVAPPEAPSSEETAAADGITYFAVCGGEAKDLEELLQPIVADLSAQKIPYTRKPANEWRDCSGNFLRLSSYLASACPDHQVNLIAPPGVKAYKPGASNAVPFDVPYRSSRSVAQWYQEQGRFTPIYYDGVASVSGIPADLHKHRDLIRPGAVLWFSRGKPTSAEGVNALFNKTGTGSHINHMGTVTSVRRNESGEAIGFEMYHGHGRAEKGTPASVTRRQYWEWPAEMLGGGTKEYPPMGYWSQRLVGIGTLVPVVNAPEPFVSAPAR